MLSLYSYVAKLRDSLWKINYILNLICRYILIANGMSKKLMILNAGEAEFESMKL